MRDTAAVIQFVGYANAGKTSTIAEVTRRFQADGFQVGVIKHDGHDAEWDQQGSDTWHFQQAGAPFVAIQSASKMAWFVQRPWSLDEMILTMTRLGATIILVEGFKREHYPKIAILRKPSEEALVASLTNCLGVVSSFPYTHPQLPVFQFGQTKELYEFLKKKMT